MGLKRTKLLGIQGITGISTVGIYTVGTTQTAGGVGIASTTYLRGAIFHNTGLGSCTTGLYVYPGDVSVVGHGATIYRFCLLYTSPSPRDRTRSRMPSSA